MRVIALPAFPAALLCIICVGCDDGRPERVHVSGTVLIDGRPLESGGVRFFPENGRPSTGEIQSGGRFSLFTYEEGDGCTLGKHRVTVVSVKDINSTTRQWDTPQAYARPATSGLTETVTGPEDSLTIELTWGDVQGPIVERLYGE
jgi:hypothetical protein